MNCKPGDLAIVVGAPRGAQGRNMGKTVRCIRILSDDEHFALLSHGPIWLVDRELSYSSSEGRRFNPWAPDRYLMPIRPDAETDEAVTAMSESEKHG